MEETQSELVKWLRRWAGDDEALLARQLPLHDAPAMVHVAQSLVDCVVRQYLPLPQRYGRFPDGHPDLMALPPIVDEASRRAAIASFAAQRQRGTGSLALSSAEAALRVLDELATASSRSPEDASKAWTTLFDPTGYLYMAIVRTQRAGPEVELLRAALASAIEALLRSTPCR